MDQFLCGIYSNQLKFLCSVRTLRRAVSKLEVKFLSLTYYHTFCCGAQFHWEKHITFPWRENSETCQTLGPFPGFHGVLVLFYFNLIIDIHRQNLEMTWRYLRVLWHQHTCSSKDKHYSWVEISISELGLTGRRPLKVTSGEDTSWISSQNDEKPVLPVWRLTLMIETMDILFPNIQRAIKGHRYIKKHM